MGWNEPSSAMWPPTANEGAEELQDGLFDGAWVVDHWPMAAIIENDDLDVRKSLSLTGSVAYGQVGIVSTPYD